MILTAVVIILFSLILLWSGTLQPWFCYLTLSAGVFALLFELGLFIHHQVLLRREGEQVKAKWSGMFWHGAGLQLLPAMTVMLFITRKDEMLFKAEEFDQTISLKSVRNILSIRSDQLRSSSDTVICQMLGVEKLPALHLVRAQINRFSRFRRLPLLLILLEEENQGVSRNQLLALYVRHGGPMLTAFLNRPEIRTKAIHYAAAKGFAAERVNTNSNAEVI